MSLLFSSNLPPRALVVAPHADDEVLGAGGFMALAADAGWEVQVLYLTISGYPSAFRADHSQTADRQAEVDAALKVLGARGHRVLFVGEEKHLKLDTVPQTELVSFIEGAIRDLQPSVVIAPCRGHYHQDHRATSDACVAAMRPAPHGGRPFVPVVLAYGHAHGGWGGPQFSFNPGVFVDVSPVIDRKLASLEAYASQLCEPPHPRSLSALRDHCAMWGAFAGVAYAEPFECLRVVL